MLDNILIIAILFSIVLSFLIVKVWRKKYFVKELYIGKVSQLHFMLSQLLVQLAY